MIRLWNATAWTENRSSPGSVPVPFRKGFIMHVALQIGDRPDDNLEFARQIGLEDTVTASTHGWIPPGQRAPWTTPQA